MPALPHPRTFITALIDTFARETSSLLADGSDGRCEEKNKKKSATAENVERIKIKNKNNDNDDHHNPLLNASANAKALLLTLHALYPTDVLPALDLLDGGLVVRLVMRSGGAGDVGLEEEEEEENDITVYYVRSTAATAPMPASGPSHQQRRMAPSTSDDISSGQSTLGNGASTTIFYEVRTKAWNCTCPAFMLAAFPVRKPLATDLAAADDLADDTGASGRLDDGGGGGGDGDGSSIINDDGNVQRQEDVSAPAAAGGATTTTDEDKKTHQTDWSFGGGSRRNGRNGGTCSTETPVCKHLLACLLAQRCGVFAGMVQDRTVSRAEMAAWAAGV